MAPNNCFPYRVCLGVRFSWNKHPFAYWHEGFMLFWADSDLATAGRRGVAGRDGCLSGNWHLRRMASNVTDTLETLFQLILTITWADIMQVLQAKNVIRWPERKSHSWWEWNLGWIPRSHFKPSLFLLPVPGSLTDLFKFHFLRWATWQKDCIKWHLWLLLLQGVSQKHSTKVTFSLVFLLHHLTYVLNFSSSSLSYSFDSSFLFTLICFFSVKKNKI